MYSGIFVILYLTNIFEKIENLKMKVSKSIRWVFIIISFLLLPGSALLCQDFEAQSKARTYVSNARFLIRIGRKDKAIYCLKKALELDRSNKEAEELLKKLTEKTEFSEGPKKTISFAELKLTGYESEEDLLLLGAESLKKGKTDFAKAYFMFGIQLYPDSALLHNNLGYILEKEGKLKKAFEFYKKAYKLTKSLPDVANNYAYLLLKLNKDIDKAGKILKKLVKKYPENKHYQDSLALCYLKKGKGDEAIKILKKIASSKKASVTEKLNYINALFKIGNYKEATKEFMPLAKKLDKKDKRLKPQEKLAILKCGIRAFVNTMAFDKAAKWIYIASKFTKQDDELSFYVAYILSKMKTNGKKNEKLIKSLLARIKNKDTNFGLLATALERLIHRMPYDKIIEALNKARKAMPDSWIIEDIAYSAAALYKKREKSLQALLRMKQRVKAKRVKKVIQGIIDKLKHAPKGKVYKNKIYNFSLVVPETGWQITEDTEKFQLPQAQVVLLKSDQTQKKRVIIAVTVNLNDNKLTLDQIKENNELNLPQYIEGYKKVYSKFVTVNGIKGYEICYEQQGYIKSLALFLLKGEYLIIITYSGMIDIFDVYKAEFELIKNSFKI